MIFTLPSKKFWRHLILLVSPILLTTGLVVSFALLLTSQNGGFAKELASSSPQSLPHYFQYQLYRQAPPNGLVLGESITAIDGKAEHLRSYLEWQNSPLAPHAATFIEMAHKYDLPWNLLPAICGKESTFGKKIPEGTFNCFGWGVYGKQALGLDSWDNAIETVAKGLREDYFNQGFDTVSEIEYLYTPQSANSHHRWKEGVEYFMWEIAAYPHF
jgi:hypothetical protein